MRLEYRPRLLLYAALFTLCTGLASTAFLLSPASHALEPRDTGDSLPAGLSYVPSDAAIFVCADVSAVWQHPILQEIRKADPRQFDILAKATVNEFGMSVQDVSKIVLFFPTLKNPSDIERLGLALTFNKVYDKVRLQKGLESLLPQLLPARDKVKVEVREVSDRVALVLVGLGEEYARPRKPDATGPLSSAIKAAASGKHAVVFGAAFENLPDVLRGDDLPPQVRPFQPLLRAQAITATLDLAKSIDLNAMIQSATASEAIDCEKALGALQTLLAEQLTGATKEVEMEAAKNPEVKDLANLLKAAMTTLKGAKFSASGTATRLNASLPTDLPFASAYLAATGKMRTASAAAQSANNLKQIALAMHNYHDTYGAFPPAAVCDKTGKPLLSWRVLILPYIEQQNLFKEFKLDEPWDSEHNKKLLAKMPKTYALPGITKDGGTETYYRAWVGNGAGLDWLTGTRITSITDGTSNTIMCMTAAKPAPWTKPDELEFDPDKDMTKLVGFLIDGKAQAAFYDGSVRTMTPKELSKDRLHPYITRSGGEVIPE